MFVYAIFGSFDTQVSRVTKLRNWHSCTCLEEILRRWNFNTETKTCSVANEPEDNCRHARTYCIREEGCNFDSCSGEILKAE